MGLAIAVPLLMAGCWSEDTTVDNAEGNDPSGSVSIAARALSSTNQDLQIPWSESKATPASAAVLATRQCKATLRATTKNWTVMTDADHAAYRACIAKSAPEAIAPSARFQQWRVGVEAKMQAAGSSWASGALATMQSWHEARGGQVEFDVSPKSGRLVRVSGSLSALLPVDPAAAKGAATVEVLPKLVAATGGKLDEWQEVSFGPTQGGGAWALRMERRVCGVPVEADTIDLVIAADPHHPTALRVRGADLRTSAPTPAVMACAPTASKQAAAALAATTFAQAEPASSTTSELRVIEHQGTLRLVWRVSVSKPSDDRAVYLDAQTLEVVRDRPGRVHSGSHSGALTARVRQPFQSTTVEGAMCFAKVYEHDTKSNLLTTTDVSGNYAVTSHPNGSDHTWEVYLDGTFAQQIDGTPADLDGLPADGGTDYAVQTTGTDQRAIEAYYLMNYVRLLNQSAWSGMPVYSPAKFQFSAAWNNCNGICCNSFNGEVTLAQAACAGIPNSSRTEQAWRWLVTHETGHLNFPATGGDQTCGLCVAANEALADVQAYIANRVEWLRSEAIGGGCGTDGDNFAPDRIYQVDECTTEAHDTGNIFAGVYLDLYYELGWRDTLARMLRMIDLVGSQTQWQDNSGSDSFYEHTLAADVYFWDIGAWQHTIGAAWKRHDDRDTVSSFDWRDQLPGSANPAFQIPVPSTASFTTYTSGPDSFLPRLAIDFNLDRDYFWVQTFAGETYTARTWNLCSGVDPQLEWIRIVTGAESVIATSDDCADTGYGNNPCLVVQSGSNGWAALRVRQEVGDADTGCYDFEIKVSDDAGDTAAASRAIANNGEWLTGAWEQAGDADFYRVYVKDAGGSVTLDIETCEVTPDTNPDTVVTLYYQDDLVNAVDSNDDNNNACGTVTPRRASLVSYAVPNGKAGWYYVKVHEYGNDGTGSYKLRATQTAGDRDVGGSGRSTAFVVSTNELTGRYIAGDIASSSGEDWFKVTLSEQEHVTFHTIDGSLDTFIEVHDDGTSGYAFLPDATRRWLRKDDDGGFQSLRSQSHFVAPRAGDYYVRVKGFGSNTGAYTLVVQQMGYSATAYPAFP